jgi:putative transposase
MQNYKSQAHVKWECKYHIVILPKYRKRALYGKLRRGIGEILRELCRQKGIGLEEGKAIADHIHVLLSIPPKYSVAMTIGYLKAKSAIQIHHHVLRTQGTLFGRSFWARGYFVSTVGINEGEIRQYIKEQEDLQKNQLELDLN